MKTSTKINYPAELPIVACRERIVSSIRENQVLIVAGETGSGKTTQLPKMCLEAGRGRRKIIGCTQPRRLAATSMAARLADELGPDGPALVGHKIRFQDRTDSRTRIKFMTDGVLLAEMQGNRKLSGYDTLIIDEAHERSLNIDFLLGILQQLLQERNDLKLIISSATIDTGKFSRHFDQAPVIEVSGRAYPVEVRYRPAAYYRQEEDEGEDNYLDRAVEAVMELRREKNPGDILIFMPTERDIRETVELLAGALARTGKTLKDAAGSGPTVILPLFGRLSAAEQNRIFRPVKGQKIVVATNVAETSITVPGVRYVIDTGLARISRYNARARTMSLPVTPISRASCEQRQGRSGRTGPGVCVRLYSEDDYLGRDEYTLPEIRRSNLAEVILRMISLKLGDPANFPFIDPPPARAVRDGYALLAELGALETTGPGPRLTARGRLMARLPLDPVFSRQIIEARDHNALREVIIITAALSSQDPRTRPADQQAEADAAHAAFHVPGSDFLSYIKIWEKFQHVFSTVKSRSKMRRFCRSHFLSWQRLREWHDIHEQISEILRQEDGFLPNSLPASPEAVHKSLLSGFLRHVALKKAKNLYQGAHGKEISIFPGSGQFNRAGQWLIAAELVETSRLFARTVGNINVEWLEPLAGDLCRSSCSSPRWEKKTGRVIADEKVSLFGLVIVAARKVNYGRINPAAQQEAREIFIRSALINGELDARYPFLEHNLELVSRLEQMEDRLRQRGILADEHTLYKFYDERLDSDVCDQAGLHRFLRKKGPEKILFMSEDDVLRRLPARKKLADFPKTITVDQIRLDLSYQFKPGSADDGVTVALPAELAAHLSPDVFEWLVPGLLPEKILALLKGLPKDIRKRLIPLQQAANNIFNELEFYQGSLYRQLAEAAMKIHGCRISAGNWQKEALPGHLQMRFCLLDADGRTLKTGRDLAAMLPALPTRTTDRSITELKSRWEKQDISPADLDGQPAKIPLEKNHKIYGYAFPGLVAEENNSVAVRLFSSQEASRQATRQGLPALYRQHFTAQFKALEKECGLVFSDRYFKRLADLQLLRDSVDRKQFCQDLFLFILQEICASQDGIIPGRAAFTARVEELQQAGLLPRGRELLLLVSNCLDEKKTTRDQIRRLAATANAAAAQRFQEYQEQLDQILPPDFLRTFDFKRLAMVSRYLQALRIRVERAGISPARDQAKAVLLAPHLARLREWKKPENPSPACRQLLAEYQQMIEEYRISLFAQEIKTAFPISPKRLDSKWQELVNSC